ncbi:hypothetical protein ACLMJK_004731 [Lecanora helva]
MSSDLNTIDKWLPLAHAGTHLTPELAPPHKAIKKICCLGAGYVGGPTCAVTANKCPDIEVTVVDFNQERINAWQTNHLPIYEPGLLEVLQPARDGVPDNRLPNLFFSTDVKGAIDKADLIFLCVPTPTKVTGTGAGRAADMVFVEAAVRMIAEVSKDDKIVAEKSTVPCRTAEDIRKTFAAIGKPGLHFDILSNPEFLAEGTAISDLLNPDRVLIGSLKTTRGMQAAASLADVYRRWVLPSRVITMNLWSSEMAKLSANALLAQRISSINALSAVCEATGADIDEVSYACGLDNRIGSRMLKSSVGFGGSCFKKDVLNLVYIAETNNLPEVAAYWKGVIDINEYQKDRFIKRIVKCLFSTLTNKKVAILGYAYKKDTGDTRESAAISIVNHLLTENAEVRIYDPKVEAEQIWQSLKETNDEKKFEAVKKRVAICSTSYEACEDANAVVIATEWDEFSNKTATKPTLGSHGAPKAPRPSFGESGRASFTTERSTESSRSSLDRLDPCFSTSVTEASIKSPLTEMSRQSSVTESSRDSLDEAMAISERLAHYSIERPNNVGAVRGLGSNVSERFGIIDDLKEEDETRKRMEWSHVARVMRRPMYVFDGRNVVDAEKLGQLGFLVEGIGKTAVGGSSR